MKITWFPIVLAILLAIVPGCRSMAQKTMPDKARASELAQLEQQQHGRMLIWNATLSLAVDDVPDAAAQITAIAKKTGGYVESKSDAGEGHAHMVVRVPVDALKTTVASFAALGDVTQRRVSSRDVTDHYVDTDARLKTKIALRDRLRKLLDKAQDVQDILDIERELTRVQSDIDAMQALLKSLKSKVDLATIEVSVDRKRILGPIGYVFKGLWWAVGKLFVIQS